MWSGRELLQASFQDFLNHRIQGISPAIKAKKHGTPRMREKNSVQPRTNSFEWPMESWGGITPMVIT
jgi:hypothetical protein